MAGFLRMIALVFVESTIVSRHIVIVAPDSGSWDFEFESSKYPTYDTAMVHVIARFSIHSDSAAQAAAWQ